MNRVHAKYFWSVGVVLMLMVLGYQGNQISHLENKITSLNAYIDTQSVQLELLEEQLMVLNEAYQSGDKKEDYWFWEALSYPSTPEKLIASLAGQEELIPFDGVLGGETYFVLEEAKILDPSYVFVPIEDGHMLGGMLLKYEFIDDKQVEWLVVDGWCPKLD